VHPLRPPLLLLLHVLSTAMAGLHGLRAPPLLLLLHVPRNPVVGLHTVLLHAVSGMTVVGWWGLHRVTLMSILLLRWHPHGMLCMIYPLIMSPCLLKIHHHAWIKSVSLLHLSCQCTRIFFSCLPHVCLQALCWVRHVTRYGIWHLPRRGLDCIPGSSAPAVV